LNIWVVKEEFVPGAGAKARGEDELAAIVERLRSKFTANSLAGNPSPSRLVISAKVEFERYEEAEDWGRAVLYDAVTDELPDWILDRLVGWPGQS
jgi:hypothetical protein